MSIPISDDLKAFAIISPDNIVGNVIICDNEDWVKSHPDWVDLTVVDVTSSEPRVSVFWTYNPKDNTFTAPVITQDELAPLPATEEPTQTIPTYDEIQAVIAKANGTTYTPVAPILPIVNSEGAK